MSTATSHLTPANRGPPPHPRRRSWPTRGRHVSPPAPHRAAAHGAHPGPERAPPPHPSSPPPHPRWRAPLQPRRRASRRLAIAGLHHRLRRRLDPTGARRHPPVTATPPVAGTAPDLRRHLAPAPRSARSPPAARKPDPAPTPPHARPQRRPAPFAPPPVAPRLPSPASRRLLHAPARRSRPAARRSSTPARSAAGG
nr:basic proline-rich protein-like [Aegilops tauschii subsp. strangulata]